MEQLQPQVQVNRPRCPYCHDDVGPEEEKVGCPSCMAWSHQACWEEAGRCGACNAVSSAVGTPPAPECLAEGCERPGVGFGILPPTHCRGHDPRPAWLRRALQILAALLVLHIPVGVGISLAVSSSGHPNWAEVAIAFTACCLVSMLLVGLSWRIPQVAADDALEQEDSGDKTA